ncbi:tripartite tricarboxylate transporter TctB family protein [Silicimonas sp. MF1-12-2]|jgi:putative tricarboxylic transport membrane protein|uniref:tripartite tricarboxylate transporter TctB family protein n=1 Tax=Silicimonas sp. MF1-12-2 TaxID=3384793 RepID=UPI0039B47521
MKYIKLLTAEAWLAGGLALLGLLGFVFMSQLVAPPKLLFGRSLTAIPPSLFPALVLGSLAVLAAALLYSRRGSLLASESKTFEEGALRRVVMLFGVMFFYALTMQPFGFFISSALSMAAVSWIAGNRSVFQIIAVSVLCPIGLYLVSTRGLAVSLPELSSIEFLYARVFDPSPVAGIGAEGASQ